MRRHLLGFAMILVFARPCLARQTTATSELLIRLDVRSAPAPRPALRYRLLPDLTEMSPGNPIQAYMKCMMEQKKFYFDEEAIKNNTELLAMPLKELPAQELPEDGRYVLTQIDTAARLDNPDWQTLPRLRADGIELLLPEVQQIRGLARALQVRFRAEIAQRRFDDAIRTAKTMFAMSRHLGEHPTLIGNLVGMAIASMTMYNLDEMLKQPGCPNLYWALTDLPTPLIGLDKGMDGERVMLQWFFRDLKESSPMSKAQLGTFTAEADRVLEMGQEKSKKPGVREWLEGRTKDVAVVRAARQRLVERGLREDQLRTFPAEQVILLDEKRELEERCDDDWKVSNFPHWQAVGLAAQRKDKKPPAIFADALFPVSINVRRAQARVDQKIAILRHVEALRLHAAGDDGKLPAKLSDIAVPLPVDPFSGKPFRYELVADTAHLRGTPPTGMEKVPEYNMHYEVVIHDSK